MKALYINDTGGYESTWPSLTPLATWVTHAPAPQWQIHPFSLGTQGLSTASPWGPNHFLEKWPTLHPGIGGFAFFPFHLQLQGVRRCVWQEEWMYLQHLSQFFPATGCGQGGVLVVFYLLWNLRQRQNQAVLTQLPWSEKQLGALGHRKECNPAAIACRIAWCPPGIWV